RMAASSESAATLRDACATKSRKLLRVTSELFRSCLGASLCQSFDRVPVAADQRLFLSPGPTFELPFGGNGVSDAVEMLRPYQQHGAPFECVAPIRADLMLLDAPREVVSGGTADVIGVIGAAQHIDVRAHLRVPTP